MSTLEDAFVSIGLNEFDDQNQESPQSSQKNTL